MKNNEGSSVIGTMLAISIAVIMIKTAWSIAVYTMDIALLRAQEQGMFYSAQGVLNQGIKIAQESFDQIMAGKDLVLIERKSFTYKTFLELKPDRKNIQVKATVINAHNYQKIQRCFVTKKIENKERNFSYCIIDAWQPI